MIPLRVQQAQMLHQTLFSAKKEALSLDNSDWLYLKENKDGIIVNQYFADNPDMIIGDMKLVSGPHGQETACVPNEMVH